jgi:hypothetical protein
MMPEERFRVLCGHLGGGNPAGGIWIIGWEEAGEWKSEYDIDKFIAERGDQVYDSRPPGDPQIRKWGGLAVAVSKICYEITGIGRDWRGFRETSFLTADGPLYMSNLYPIARANVSAIPADYPKWFGYSNQREYETKVLASGRFDHLREMWRENAPRITICHGKGKWHDFRKMLNIREQPDLIDEGRIEEYPGGIFLTPHLSRSTHMPMARIKLLAERGRTCWSSDVVGCDAQ